MSSDKDEKRVRVFFGPDYSVPDLISTVLIILFLITVWYLIPFHK